MIREEFAEFLKELRKINDNGGDIDTFVKKHEHRNVYFYNDGCIKKILASEKNLTSAPNASRTQNLSTRSSQGNWATAA
ncbi:hypothetical protein [uncultured Fibrobacter sp.]|uniref:hypothetical protein n=1 Tax=uncultured Fibrobacter sp. TaxID=261512 RepID=UPI0025CCFD06|nr:hypothetical protein [uncultured Fibrobacter sp.]